MTELLQQVFAQIVQLSPEQQDAIAARFLAELQDEQKWEASFAATTDEQWDQMAAIVRQEIASEVSIAAALQELQKLCTEENYTLTVPLEVPEGTSVEIIIPKPSLSPQRSPADILAKIAALPLENNGKMFSGQDHDQVLYSNQDSL